MRKRSSERGGVRECGLGMKGHREGVYGISNKNGEDEESVIVMNTHEVCARRRTNSTETTTKD